MFMKKLLLLLSFMLLPFVADAQVLHLKIGYFSMDSVLHAMPEYVASQKNMADLTAKYEAETKRAEDEFNKKYEEFLDGQRDFAPSILKKRQAELQELMDKNVAFKKESLRLLDQARNEALASLKAKVNAEIKRMGETQGFVVILNTDGDAAPFIASTISENLTPVLKAAVSSAK